MVPPTGTVTFLFTDIQGSTPLWEQMPAAMEISIARHHTLLRQAIEACDGVVFQIVGDAFQGAFSLASQALEAAVEAQRLLQSETWNATGPLRVRMGLHTGPAETDERGEYVTCHTLNRTARVMSAAHGGQILLSNVAADLVARELPAGVTLKDLGEHRLKGMILLEHLYQVVTEDLPQSFPPLTTGAAPPNNLPAQISSFIGRQAEIVRIKELIDLENPGRNRLVTLLGPGGTGKTRLSLQIGHELKNAFIGGTWFIELAPISNPELVQQTILTGVGLQSDANRPAIAVLGDYFHEKIALLILDNCEHLVGVCAQICDHLLQTCSHLHILTSSREVLGINGETIFHVPPLSLTRVERPSPEDILHSEAGLLFVDRATAVHPDFCVTTDNAPGIAQLCCQLDGIPLAIELAAARTRVLTVNQIVAHLDDRFRLLTGGSRAALPRHQTLKALVDWSWDLLTQNEQVLLRRLSVFAGGWDLEASERIWDDPIEILDLLFQLNNKSLIIIDKLPGQPRRFRMLETIRQYCLEKLFISGEFPAIHTRHHDWFLELAERAEPELKSHGQTAWANRLELEHDNLRLAMSWSLEQGQAEAALRLASALHYFWWIRGYFNEGRHSLEAALNLAANTQCLDCSLWHARALLALCWIERTQGDYSDALTHVEQGLRMARSLADRQTVGFGLFLKGSLKFDGVKPAVNRSILQESLVICKEIDDKWVMAGCNRLLAETVMAENPREGCALFEESVALYREIGDRLILTYPLPALAWMVFAQGNAEKARQYFEESLSILNIEGRNDSAAYTFLQLTAMERWQGNFTHAHELNAQSWAIYQEMGNQPGKAWARCLLAELDHLQGHPELARPIYEENIKKFFAFNDNWKAGWCMDKLGDVFFRLGDLPKAISVLKESITLLGMVIETNYPLMVLGDIERIQCNYESAMDYYQQSLEKLSQSGVQINIPGLLEAMAKLALAQDSYENAAWLFGVTQTAREKLKTPVPPIDFPDYQRHIAILESRSGDEKIASAWRAGRAMSLELAIVDVTGKLTYHR